MGLSPIAFPAALLLTVLYVMVAVVLIFVPSVGRYHRELLDNHINPELAVLPFNEPGGDALSEDVRSHLLQSAGALAVTLRSAERAQMYQIADEPPVIGTTIDLTTASFFTDMYDAVDCLFADGHRILYVIAKPTRLANTTSIAILLKEKDIRNRLVAYANRVIVTGILVSLITGLLVFVSLISCWADAGGDGSDGGARASGSPANVSACARGQIGIASAAACTGPLRPCRRHGWRRWAPRWLIFNMTFVTSF